MEQVREALRVFLKESCDFLASQPSEFREWTRIVWEDQGRISFRVEVLPDFSQGLLRFRLRLNKTPSPVFDRLVDVVRQDAPLRGVLLVDARGEPIEEEKDERWWLENMLAGTFVQAYVNRTKGVQFDEQAFGDLFERFRQDIESSDIMVTELSPVMNLEIESDQIQIEPGIRLRQLLPDELEEWLNADRLFPSQPLTPHHLLKLRCAAEVIYQQNRHAAFGSNPDAHEKVSRLITAIRLLTDGFPRLAFTKRRTSSLFTRSLSTGWRALTPRLGPSAKIRKSQEFELIDLYKRVGSSPNLSGAGLALVRWNSAGDRPTEEDKLIDYWIALESLFVPDTTQELSYRTALRIAAFIGSNGPERQRIYGEMKDSYRLRSEIVHGSIRKKRKKLTASELTGLTRSYLKRALLRTLESDQRFDPTKLEAQLLAKE